MSTTWILTANASIARLYSNRGPNKGLELVKEFSHPESREKGVDLVTDRPGHNQSHGNGHGAYVPASDPRQNEADRFALELARELDQARSSHSFDRLIVIASSPFMGTLNSRLPDRLRTMVADTVEKDYTRASEKELKGLLEDRIFL